MKISAKTEYACIAMLELALQYKSGEPVRIRKIAERHGAPPRFLVQILLQLKGAGFVASVRGAAGGYRLLIPPERISLGRVMEVIDGPGEENNRGADAATDSPLAGVLAQVWNEAAAAQQKVLDGITLADLLERAKQPAGRMYHI
jgi:Rrf2 family protein